MSCSVKGCREASLASLGFDTPPDMPSLCGEHTAPWLAGLLKSGELEVSPNQVCQECNGRPAEDGLAVCFDCRVIAEKFAVVA